MANPKSIKSREQTQRQGWENFTRRSFDSRGDSKERSEDNVANANINGTKRNQPEDGQRSRTQQSSEDVADTEQSRSFSKSIGNIGSVGEKIKREEKGGNQSSIRTSTRSTDVANTRSERLERQLGSQLQGTREGFTNGSKDDADTYGKRLEGFWTKHELREGKKEEQTCGDGWWQSEPNVGRVANGVPGRVHRLKALGNSIVPKIAEEIGRAIMKAENEME